MPRTEVRRQTTLHSKPQYPVVKSQQPLVPSVPLPAAPPSFGQTLKEGIGFGAGSAIGHRIVGSIFGSPSTPVAPPTSSLPVEAVPGKCATERKAFELCMKTKSDDQCNNEILSYKQCIELS